MQWLQSLALGLRAAFFVLFLVAAEWSVAALLQTPWAPVAFALAAALLAGFAGATALVVRRGTRAQCLCFGTSPAVLGRRHVVRDAALAAGAVLGAALGPAALPPAAGIAVFGAAGCAVALAVVLLDEFLELFSL